MSVTPYKLFQSLSFNKCDTEFFSILFGPKARFIDTPWVLCVYCWTTCTSSDAFSIYWTYGILLDECQHWFWLVQLYWIFLSSWQMTIKIKEQYKQKKNDSWIETLPYFSYGFSQNFDFGFLGLVHITFLILKSSLEISKANQWRNVLRIS